MKLAGGRIAHKIMNSTFEGNPIKMADPKMNNFTSNDKLSINDGQSAKDEENHKKILKKLEELDFDKVVAQR